MWAIPVSESARTAIFSDILNPISRRIVQAHKGRWLKEIVVLDDRFSVELKSGVTVVIAL